MACRPYDVLSSEEAREEATKYSLLHITKPEIDFEPGIDINLQQVYDKAKENFERFKKEGTLMQDEEDHLYIYAQTMGGRTQYGLVGCAGVEDYMSGVIKKHELTRVPTYSTTMISPYSFELSLEEYQPCPFSPM